MGEYAIYFFADISSWEACTLTRKLDPDLMAERSIRTIKDTMWNRTHFFVEIVRFMRFAIRVTLFG